jgi:GntR family transcriptional regulator, negative regulator for fad regulon and positive regulator of fabA
MALPLPLRPMETAEHRLIARILDGTYSIGMRLPPERDLAAQLGVTRPTLREAIRHLEQEGWLRVQHGKPTMVQDFWREGGLGVLTRIISHRGVIHSDFITNLLELRLLIAPTYTRAAVEHQPQMIQTCFALRPLRQADAAAYAAFDWMLQRTVTVASSNVIFPLLLNGFADFYEKMALIYFQPIEARLVSADYYDALDRAVQQRDSAAAFTLTQEVMRLSIEYWRMVSKDMTEIALVPHHAKDERA